MSNQYLKLRRSAIPGKIPETSSIDFGEIALNTYDGLAFIKKSGSLGEEIVTIGASNIVGSSKFIPVFSGSNSLVTSSIYQSGSLVIIGGTASIHPEAPERLAVYAGSTNSYNLISGHGAIDNYLQLNVKNFTNGISASSDIVATAESGDETQGYINLGINNSGYGIAGAIGNALDGYLYTTGSNLLIGNTDPNKSVVIFTGGTNAYSNARVYIDYQGSVSINTSTPTPGAPEALLVQAVNNSTYNLITAKSNVNYYSQFNLINRSTGDNASADVVASNNLSTENTYFIDMGINGSNYSQTGLVGDANDAYVYSTGNDLHIGNASNYPIQFFAGGVDSNANRKLQLNPNNQHEMTGSLRVTGSITALSFTGSLFGTSSWAQNSITSSYILNAISASYAATASSAENFTVRGTLTAQTIVAQTITSSTDYITGSTRFGSLLSNTHQFTGSVSVTGSLAVNGSNVVLTNQTSSMFVLSASYATTAALAPNYVLNSSTASMLSPYVLTSSTSSMSVATASYALNAVSSSFASTASYALSVVTSSLTGSFVTLDTIQTISGSKTFSPSVTAVSALAVGTNFTPILSSSANSSTLIGLDLTPTFFTGSFTVGSNLAMRVRGNTVIYGGNDTYDYPLVVNNTAGTTRFSVRNDGVVSIPGNGLYVTSVYGASANGTLNLSSNGTGTVTINGYNQNTILDFGNSGANETQTSGICRTVLIGLNFTPTSGTAQKRYLEISPYISQSSGVTGITRGIYINPSLISAADWRSIETTNNTGYALYLSGSATNYIAGNVGIGTTTPSYKLDINGTARVGGVLTVGTINGVNQYLYIGGTPSLMNTNSMTGLGNALAFFSGGTTVGQHGFVWGNTYAGISFMQLRASTGNLLINSTDDNGFRTQINGAGSLSGSLWISGSSVMSGSLTITQGITGSLLGTASFSTTSSYALTASYWSGSVVNSTSASYADTASFAPNYVLNSSTSSMLTPYVLTSVTASMLSPYVLSSNTGSFITNSQTSSMSVLSSSFASTASSAENFTVRGTLTAQTIVVQTITSSIDYVTGSTRFGSASTSTHQFTGSVLITGSLSVNGSNVILTNQTSSMSVATASYVLNAVSSSYAGTASLAPAYVLTSVTSSMIVATASYVANVISSSYAATAALAPNYVLNSSTSSMLLPYVLTSITSSMSVATASYVLNSISASYSATTSLAPNYVLTSVTSSMSVATSSFAATSSLPLRGVITGSVAGATLTFTKGDGTTFDLTVAQSGTVSTASYVTSSGVFGPYGANSIATASYALTASYVANASSFPFTGSAIITGSLTITGSTSVQSLNIGNSQFNNTSSVTSAGTTVISQLATGSYTSCFYNYTIASASNARSGQVMSVWNGATIKYTEVTTTDIGNTATASFAVALSGANIQLNFTAPGS